MSSKSRAATNNPVIRPPMSPFDVQLSPGQQEALAKNIEALNVQLEQGKRGYFNVPLGHANAIKAAFEDAIGNHSEERRCWHVTIVSVNPTFATVVFHADGDPAPPPGEPALTLLAQVREEVAKLLGSIPVPRSR